MVFSLSPLWWIRGLWKLPDGRNWLKGKLGLFLMGGAVLSKSFIQFSVVGWGCVLTLLFDLRPNYGVGNEDNGFLQKVWCTHSYTQCPQPCSRPPPTFFQALPRDPWSRANSSRRLHSPPQTVTTSSRSLPWQALPDISQLWLPYPALSLAWLSKWALISLSLRLPLNGWGTDTRVWSISRVWPKTKAEIQALCD